MDQELVDKAKAIIEKIIYVIVATTTPEGYPWNTPVFAAYDNDYNFYWRSELNTIHSKNIKNNDKIFIVICDTTAPWGEGRGVYIQAYAKELTDKDEISQALELLDNRSPRSLGDVDGFSNDSPRRVYKAVTEKMYINNADEIDGNFVDKRIEIKLG